MERQVRQRSAFRRNAERQNSVRATAFLPNFLPSNLRDGFPATLSSADRGEARAERRRARETSAASTATPARLPPAVPPVSPVPSDRQTALSQHLVDFMSFWAGEDDDAPDSLYDGPSTARYMNL